MMFYFNDPQHGIPCEAEYDEEGESLMFNFVDYEAACNMFSSEKVNDVREWCISNHMNCGSIYRAHAELVSLGLIKSDLIELDIKTYKLNP